MDEGGIDLLDQIAITFIVHRTHINRETVKRVFLAEKPWFTFKEREKGHALGELAREMAECILKENQDFKKTPSSVRNLSRKNGECAKNPMGPHRLPDWYH